MIEKFTPEEIKILQAELRNYDDGTVSKKSICKIIENKAYEIFDRDAYKKYILWPASEITKAISCIADNTLGLFEMKKNKYGRDVWMKQRRVADRKKYLQFADEILEVVKKYKDD